MVARVLILRAHLNLARIQSWTVSVHAIPYRYLFLAVMQVSTPKHCSFALQQAQGLPSKHNNSDTARFWLDGVCGSGHLLIPDFWHICTVQILI